MSIDKRKVDEKSYRVVNLSRLEALGDAIFAFSLTLLALDLRLPEIASAALARGPLPKLLVLYLRSWSLLRSGTYTSGP